MRFEIKKGNCVLVDGIWHVIVSAHYVAGNLGFNCICDNANNIYYWRAEQIEEVFELKDIGYRQPKASRTIPYQVIAEVLSGEHDTRFQQLEIKND